MRIRIPRELPETGYKAEERIAINALIRAVKALQPIQTPTTEIEITETGTAIRVKATGDGGGDNVWL